MVLTANRNQASSTQLWPNYELIANRGLVTPIVVFFLIKVSSSA